VKKIIPYYLFLSLVLLSCSKTKPVPDPSVELTFGTLSSGTYTTFVPFKNQDTIELSQLDTIKYFYIKISEMHLDSSYFVGTQRKPIFNVDISSNTDNEHFLSGSNCFLGGYGGSGNTDCTIEGEIYFPFRISKNPIHDNNILELNSENGYLVISYLSVYSKLLVGDSLFVYKR
jgi:hypothetical protein